MVAYKVFFKKSVQKDIDRIQAIWSYCRRYATEGNWLFGKFSIADAMYIPIVVAMAARQNVIAAIDGGLIALVAGVAAVIASFAMVPVLSKLGSASSTDGRE